MMQVDDKTLNQLIIDTLAPLGVPVSFARYNLTADTYIVFNVYNAAPRQHLDDKEVITKFFIQLDVFSRGNYLKLCKDAKNLLKEKGFGRMFESETYNEDLKMFRRIIRLNYENKYGEDIY